MSTAVTLAYASAACAVTMAFIAIFRSWRSIAVWFFCAGMGLLALASVFLGLATHAIDMREARFWHLCALGTMSFLPGVWLLFSLSYARGNYREFFQLWRWAVTAAFALPAALLCIFPRWGSLISPVELNDDALWVFRLD